jgi:hypothetical protein
MKYYFYISKILSQELIRTKFAVLISAQCNLKSLLFKYGLLSMTIDKQIRPLEQVNFDSVRFISYRYAAIAMDSPLYYDRLRQI